MFGPRGPVEDPGDLTHLPAPAGPRLVRARSDRAAAVRSTLIAVASTAVVFGILAWLIVNAPGWPRVQHYFFNAEVFAKSWPAILSAFWVNVRLFLIAEVLILAFGLVLAILRSLPGPVMFPVRLMATIYVDLFRALPGILVIAVLGFGIVGLGIAGIPTDPFFYGVVALTLIYSAYVSEVYRAGIESIHPSQEAAARSLGLTQVQALRHVIVPQAIRRVIPPLLNDFIGLQKDTVLVSIIGVVEAFRVAQIKQSGNFNMTPYVALALIYLVITIPLARLTDWLVARDRRRAAAGAR